MPSRLVARISRSNCILLLFLYLVSVGRFLFFVLIITAVNGPNCARVRELVCISTLESLSGQLRPACGNTTKPPSGTVGDSSVEFCELTF